MKMLSGLLILTLSLPAFAELGGRPTAPQAVRFGAKSVRQAAPSPSYTVQEIEAQDGIKIREYILASGDVFAVTWSGPTMPDLRSLFGSANFQSYLDEIRTRPPGRRPVHVERPDLVVQSGGHQRAFRGRAYLPQRVPANVSIDEIK